MLEKIHMLQDKAYHDPVLRPWLPHFDRWENAERRNRIIYDMALAGLRYDAEMAKVAAMADNWLKTAIFFICISS